MRKFIVLAAFLALAGGVVWKLLATGEKQAGRRDGIVVVAVETATIRPADLSDRSVFTGSVRATERFDAAPKITELVRDVKVGAGDVVRRGDVLAVLDDEEYVLAVEQGEASLAVARANAEDAASQLEITSRDYSRAERLVEETVISAQEFDRYEATHAAQKAKYDVAVAELALSETALKAAKVKLAHTRVTADWSGGADARIVALRHLDPGAMAMANEPILTIIAIDVVKAVISVNEKDYAKIVPGFPVTVTTDAFPGRKFAGTVDRVAQELATLSREAEVEISVPNPDLALKPGMFIRAEIEFAHRADAPAAPFEAVVRRETGDRGVFLVELESSQVSFTPVTEGISDRGWVELVNGGHLVGSEVVVLGQHLLREGTKVIVPEKS